MSEQLAGDGVLLSAMPEFGAVGTRDEHSLAVTAFGALQKAKRGGKDRVGCAPRIT